MGANFSQRHGDLLGFGMAVRRRAHSRKLGDGRTHGERGMAGEHRVSLARMRHPECGLESVAQVFNATKANAA